MLLRASLFACLLIATALLLPPTEVLCQEWGQSTPSESECRPYIEKALKELGPADIQEAADTQTGGQEALETTVSAEQEAESAETESAREPESKESVEEPVTESDRIEGEQSEEATAESSKEAESQADAVSEETTEDKSAEVPSSAEGGEVESVEQQSDVSVSKESEEAPKETEEAEASAEAENVSAENLSKEDEKAQESASIEQQSAEEDTVSGEQAEGEGETAASKESQEQVDKSELTRPESAEATEEESRETETTNTESEEEVETPERGPDDDKSVEESAEGSVKEEVKGSALEEKSEEEAQATETSKEEEASEEQRAQSKEDTEEKSAEDTESKETEGRETVTSDSVEESEKPTESKEEKSEEVSSQEVQSEETAEGTIETKSATEGPSESEPSGETEPSAETEEATVAAESEAEGSEEKSDEAENEPPAEEVPSPEEEDLTLDIEIPEKLRPRDHISEILRLDVESAESELLLGKTIDYTLRELKKLYESAIKPLEILYKYRDLSNRHFGDPEVFSKPLILFMGPWSGGKSTIINYLLDNEYKKSALRTGAEPSPAYFNIVMWGEREEVLDGTQLAADWTFSGLQKFGQGLLDRLRGLKLNHSLLEKVNIVEIPGILEIRKQMERVFPFNDACQWFIDRADIIFLVYDPAKLDVGPESEAILDQLKGREYQTRIILNKADQVKPEELMRVQGTLIWNISPLMSSTEPPVMYSTSLWSLPYESGAPTRLLYAQEKAFLRDLRDAIDKRVENKIASARRFAVRVRNHAKMVDCYLTTYYNHKTFFGNRKIISDDIIEHPQNYHIYEGLSTLTNISRYDLPDPDVYKDFFRLNPVYDFQQLSATCTYFRGCPINRLDVAIAYELPELVGKYKKSAEEVLQSAKKSDNS